MNAGASAKNESVQDPFDSVAVLAADSGLVGRALQRLPDWLLREADRWPDPWQFLLGVRDLPKGFQLLFNAAESQRTALSRIAEITRGAGSIETSWTRKLKEAIRARDWKAVHHAEAKLLRSMWRVDRGRWLLAAAKNHSPAMVAEARKRIDALEIKMWRKHGRRKADNLCQPIEFKPETGTDRKTTHRIAWELACGWMRNRNGTPGYCFFSDTALRDTLAIYLRIPGLAFDTVRDTRQFIRLKKASPFVYSARQDKDGSLELLDRRGRVVWPEQS